MTPEHIAKVLSDIQSRIPKSLLRDVVSEVKATPTAEFVVDKALESKEIGEEKKKHLQILKDNGDFNKKIIVENKKIARIINEFVAREINKEIKKGNLPRGRDVKQFLPTLKHLIK
jgi:hypothetical protein